MGQVRLRKVAGPGEVVGTGGGGKVRLGTRVSISKTIVAFINRSESKVCVGSVCVLLMKAESWDRHWISRAFDRR